MKSLKILILYAFILLIIIFLIFTKGWINSYLQDWMFPTIKKLWPSNAKKLRNRNLKISWIYGNWTLLHSCCNVYIFLSHVNWFFETINHQKLIWLISLCIYEQKYKSLTVQFLKIELLQIHCVHPSQKQWRVLLSISLFFIDIFSFELIIYPYLKILIILIKISVLEENKINDWSSKKLSANNILTLTPNLFTNLAKYSISNNSIVKI